MPLMLRRIKKQNWYKQTHPWLDENEIPADPLADMNTSENSLSVWYITDDKANLSDVVAAIAANRESLSNLDYAIFDSKVCSGLGIEIEHSPGDTPHRNANKNWHRDLKTLSGNKLLALTAAIYRSGTRKRTNDKEVLGLLVAASSAGTIPIEDIKGDSLREKVERKLRSGG